MKNSVFKKDHVEAVYEERFTICKECEKMDTIGTYCTAPGTQPCCSECGCSLKFKLRSLHSECPLGKWKALTTEQENKMIQSQIENNDSKNI